LPSEAEWEYCCRAKTTTRFCCGDDENSLKDYANLADASFIQNGPGSPVPGLAWNDGYPFTAPVGKFQANAFGLYDMHGNVAEWCADWYDKNYYKNSPKQDPPGPPRPNARNERVVRGSAWSGVPTYCRSSFRNHPSSASSAQNHGFRVVLLPEKPVAKADTPPQEQSPKVTNSHPVDVPPVTTPRNDYDELAKGRWIPVLPSVEEFNRLRNENAYRAEKVYKGTEPRFIDGVLHCDGGSLHFPTVKAKDVIVRAWVKKLGPKNNGNLTLRLRNEVAVWFNGGDYFGIGKSIDGSWKELAYCHLSETYDDFFEFAFVAVGDRLVAYVNGRKILEARDRTPPTRPEDARVGTHSSKGLFRNIEVQVLDKLPTEVKGPIEDKGSKGGQPTAKKAEPKKKASLSDRIPVGTVLTGTYEFIKVSRDIGTATLTITEREGNKVKGRWGAKAANAAVAYPGFAFEGAIVGSRLTARSVTIAAKRTLTVSLKGDTLEGILVHPDTGATARVAFKFDK